MRSLDLAVLFVYVAGVVIFGCRYVRRSRTTREFTVAGGRIPAWAVALSIFGTYLSSNTFLGVPGKAYGSDWNSFVFSLSLPLAVILAVRVFVPFYRRSGEVSAYHHLEVRFGAWARTYAVVCYLLTQLSRMGAILFGVALALKALTGWPLAAIIVVGGILITLYTLLGGIEAVIWTDVVQSLVLIVGALVVAGVLASGMPEGPGQILRLARAEGKMSLGQFGPGLSQSTFWVVLVYGVVMNLNNFGIDQSYVQRYHVARSAREAARSVWFGALLYIPVSFLFFWIGTSLYAYYQTHPEMLAEVRTEVAETWLREQGLPITGDALAEKASALTPADIGDRVLPHFIVRGLPPGLAGLLLAAILAAAMSSIDTSLNSSATVTLEDLYRRYLRPGAGEADCMRVLHLATLAWGVLAVAVSLAMLGVRSVLDAWWALSGTFAGGMLGLFLLGVVSRRASRREALAGACTGVAAILWLTFSPKASWLPVLLRSPFHPFLVSVFGTAVIVCVGLAVGAVSARSGGGEAG